MIHPHEAALQQKRQVVKMPSDYLENLFDDVMEHPQNYPDYAQYRAQADREKIDAVQLMDLPVPKPLPRPDREAPRVVHASDPVVVPTRSVNHSSKDWAKRLLGAGDFLVVDTETTGFKPESEVIQVTAVNSSGRCMLSCLCRPLQPVDEAGEAFKFHGITNQMLKGAPAWSVVAGILSDLACDYRFIAFNAAFDKRLINQTSAMNGWPHLAADWECVMQRYMDHSGDKKKTSLANACERLGVACVPTHDALADCLATLGLIRAMAGEG